MNKPDTAPSGAAPADVREALMLARDYVFEASVSGYDGTQGTKIRAEAIRRLALIDAALASREASQLPSDATAADFGTWLLGHAKGQVVTDRDMAQWWLEYCAECDAPNAAALASPQVAPAPEQLQEAHRLGFLRCAGWTQRDDLFGHRGVLGATYRKDRDEDLSRIAAPVQVAPAGFKLVPIEPTAEMMAAAWDHTPLHMYDMTDGDFGQAYKDMLAAAPAAPMPTPAAADDARDAARLDWLDGVNKALNGHYGTQYGWKLVMSPNVTRLLCGPTSAGHLADLDLHDSASGASKSTSIREAIDAAMSLSTPAAKPADPAEEQGS